jgi:hypothetical protein
MKNQEKMKLKKETIDTLNTLTSEQVKALHALIEYLEGTEEHEHEIPISDLFEDAFISVFIS